MMIQLTRPYCMYMLQTYNITRLTFLCWGLCPVCLYTHMQKHATSQPHLSCTPLMIKPNLASCLLAPSYIPQASELHLPAPNPFIPSDFSLRPAPPGAKQSDPPVLLAEDVRLRLWHKTELSFEAPKAVVNLDFQVGACCQDKCWSNTYTQRCCAAEGNCRGFIML